MAYLHYQQGSLGNNTPTTFSNGDQEKKVDLDRTPIGKGSKKHNKTGTSVESTRGKENKVNQEIVEDLLKMR